MKHEKFEQTIEQAARHPLCGVRLILAPPKSGKTTIARSSCQQQISSATVLQNYHTLSPNNPYQWLIHELGVTQKWTPTLEEILPKCAIGKPHVIVLDHADEDQYQWEQALYQDLPSRKDLFAALAKRPHYKSDFAKDL